MREVVKWNKNYATGECIEKKALKPDNIIGRAKIEVFDGDGNLKDETFTENIILSNFELYPNYYYDQLYKGLRRVTSLIYGYNSTFAQQFNAMELRNSTITEEHKDNRYIAGDVVGYCPYMDTNAGADIRRGVYNASESFERYESDGYYHAHLVYDFGTSQGNGEFNSIWWNNARGSSGNYTAGINAVTSDKSIYRRDGCPILARYNPPLEYRLVSSPKLTWYKASNGKIYVDDGTGTLKILKNKKEVLNCLASPIYEDGISFKVPNARSFSNNTRHFRATGTGFGNSISKANLNPIAVIDVCNSENDEVIKTVSIPLYQGITDLEEMIANCPENDTINTGYDTYFCTDEGVVWGYLCLESYRYDTKVFPKLLSDGSYTESYSDKRYFMWAYDLINERWVVKPGRSKASMWRDVASLISTTYTAYHDRLKVADGVYTFLYGSSYVVVLDMNKLEWHYYNNYEALHSSSYSSDMLFKVFDEEYNLFLCDDGQAHTRINAYTAHTVLPKPVIKTSADTMKVQYDYYIQIPYVYAPDGVYIPEATPHNE